MVHVCRIAPSPTSRATALVSLVGRRSWVVDRLVGRSRGVDARRAGQLSLRARVQQLPSRSRSASTAENVATLGLQKVSVAVMRTSIALRSCTPPAHRRGCWPPCTLALAWPAVNGFEAGFHGTNKALGPPAHAMPRASLSRLGCANADSLRIGVSAAPASNGCWMSLGQHFALVGVFFVGFLVGVKGQNSGLSRAL